MPEVRTQGWVLGLVLERKLVGILLGWVSHTLCDSGCHLPPIVAVGALVVGDRSRTLAVGSGVIQARSGAVCETNLVLAGQATVHLVHREGKINFSHNRLGIRGER